eukprot:PITA_19766
MALQCLFPYPYPSNSNDRQRSRQVDCQVTACRKRPLEVDSDSQQECIDLQEIVWRDVDQITTVKTRESQIVAEKLRRKQMKYLCTQLESLLPTTPPKLDRCGLYGEAINYIRKLQEDLHQLKRKKNRLVAIQSDERTDKNTDLKVAVEIYDREAIISLTSQRRPRYMWRILEELENHDLDVETSQLFTGESFVLLYFHVKFRDNISHDPAQIQISLECRLQLTY